MRRGGEFLAKMEKARAGRPPKNRSPDGTDFRGTTLADLGMSKNASSRWQRIFKIPTRDFERQVGEAKDQGGELTTKGMLSLAARLNDGGRNDEILVSGVPIVDKLEALIAARQL